MPESPYKQDELNNLTECKSHPIQTTNKKSGLLLIAPTTRTTSTEDLKRKIKSRGNLLTSKYKKKIKQLPKTNKN